MSTGASMSKLTVWLAQKGLYKEKSETPLHVRVLLDLVIDYRFEGFAKWEVREFLGLTEAQADWLWKHTTQTHIDYEAERREQE